MVEIGDFAWPCRDPHVVRERDQIHCALPEEKRHPRSPGDDSRRTFPDRPEVAHRYDPGPGRQRQSRRVHFRYSPGDAGAAGFRAYIWVEVSPHMTDPIVTAFYAGKDAVPGDRNPYAEGTPEWHGWRNGWSSEHAERRPMSDEEVGERFRALDRAVF
jgi:hypothetical protein